MPDQPSGTVTFLVTDIENSSGLWDHHPAAMGEALARHDAIVKSAVAAAAGYIFATGGDGFSVVFQQPMQAVEAAIAAQRALEAEDWGEVGAVRVAMAIHTGIAQERAGDYFGPPVNHVARIASFAHGGDVVISATTFGLLRYQLQAAGLSVKDRGLHRLKGITAPARIYSLVYEAKSRSLLAHRKVLAALGIVVGVAALVVAVRLITASTPTSTSGSTTEATSAASSTSSTSEPPPGVLLWSRQMTPPLSGVDVQKGVTYVAEQQGTLIAYSLDSGDELWRFNAGGRIVNPPVVDGRTVLVARWDGSLMLGVQDGEMRLRCFLVSVEGSLSGLTPGPASVFEHSVLFGAGLGGTLVVLDPSADINCQPAPVQYLLTGLQEITAPPIVAGGAIFLGDARGDVIALRFDDPDRAVWPTRYYTGAGSVAGTYDGRVESLGAVEVTRVEASGQRTEVTLVITDAEGRMHILDGRTGRARAEPRAVVGTPFIRDTSIYFFESDDLVILDADLDEERIALPVGQAALGPIVDDGSIVYATTDGTVVSFDLDSRTYALLASGGDPVTYLADDNGRVVVAGVSGAVSAVAVPER